MRLVLLSVALIGALALGAMITYVFIKPNEDKKTKIDITQLVINEAPSMDFDTNLVSYNKAHALVYERIRDIIGVKSRAVYVASWSNKVRIGINTENHKYKFKGIGEKVEVSKGIIKGIAPPLKLLGIDQRQNYKGAFVNKAAGMDEVKIRDDVDAEIDDLINCGAEQGMYTTATLNLAKEAINARITSLLRQVNPEFPSVQAEIVFENEEEFKRLIQEKKNNPVKCDGWIEDII